MVSVFDVKPLKVKLMPRLNLMESLYTVRRIETKTKFTCIAKYNDCKKS